MRVVAGGFAYHVLNRANARMRIFDKPEDYEAFERILADAVRRVKMRLLSYCVMPNHWHLVVWPREDGDLSTFIGWLTLTHTQRWHAHRHSVGSGHVYQGRFKSFLVESDEYLWTVCRYREVFHFGGRHMCAIIRKAWGECCSSWRTWGPIAIVVLVVGMVMWFAAHAENPSEFVVRLSHELAWPLLLLVLLGHYYRGSLTSVLKRIERLELPGLKASATLAEEKTTLIERLKKATDADEERRLSTLLGLSPAALRLLGTVVAIGRSYDLPLTRYKSPEFKQAKDELRSLNLVDLDGRCYRPTLKGVEVFSEHVNMLKKKLTPENGNAG